MQYLLYCVDYFKVRGTTREVSVANVVDTTLVNRMVFMRWYAHDADVALMWYRKANGIPSPSSTDIDSP
jgi:hypothetical protein